MIDYAQFAAELRVKYEKFIISLPVTKLILDGKI